MLISYSYEKSLISGLACNSRHCGEISDLCLLTCLMSGEVYVWGFNPSQLATLPRPTLIGELPKTVVKVACGYEHFLALTSDGMVTVVLLYRTFFFLLYISTS